MLYYEIDIISWMTPAVILEFPPGEKQPMASSRRSNGSRMNMDQRPVDQLILATCHIISPATIQDNQTMISNSNRNETSRCASSSIMKSITSHHVACGSNNHVNSLNTGHQHLSRWYGNTIPSHSQLLTIPIKWLGNSIRSSKRPFHIISSGINFYRESGCPWHPPFINLSLPP